MQKISTTIEESKKLIELGLNPESADMYYDGEFLLNEVGNVTDKFQWGKYAFQIGEPHDTMIFQHLGRFELGYQFPSWSLINLFGLIPCSYQMSRNYKTNEISIITDIIDSPCITSKSQLPLS